MLRSLPEQISATEARFRDRQTEREELSTKGVFQANTPERMERRLKRLSRSRATIVTVPSGATSLAGPEPETAGDPTIERVLQQNDLLAIRYLELGLKTARCVGRIRIRDGAGGALGFGTGFLVAPRILLTNHHVLEDLQQAAQSQFELGFQESVDGNQSPVSIFRLAPSELFLTNQELDYTLVAVSPQSMDGTLLNSFGFTKLIEDQGKIVVKEAVTIIQHPNGEPKQVAMRENRVIDILPNFVQYQTDTAPGSSGSPVFNDQWEVVALHHSGVPRRDAAGNILAIDGSIWKQSMGDQRIDWIANEGVRVSRIAAHVRAQPLASAQARQLRDSLFSETVQENQSAAVPPVVSTNGRQPMPAQDSTSPVLNHGAAIWTIPLQISVQLGALQTQSMGPADGLQTLHEPQKHPMAPAPPSEDEDSVQMQTLLSIAREARAKPYYVEERDQQDREEYYRSLREDLSPQELYDRLSALLKATHARKPKYKPAVQLYPFVDLQHNRKLLSIYSQKEFEPEEFIRADFQIQRNVALKAQEAFLTESLDITQMAERVALLEAAVQLNCEHVVPQSWFNKREPMRGDLHHLFACEPGCNSFRSNTPYFEFSDFDEAIRSECGKSDVAGDRDRGFEPGGGKGSVARAVLYFLLRYPGEINNVGNEFRAGRLPILLQWHKDFPPTLYELHRNQAIFDVQGNRNPLIDFPEFAEKIDFTKGLG
jgi:endonuclease G, mitochondrial